MLLNADSKIPHSSQATTSQAINGYLMKCEKQQQKAYELVWKRGDVHGFFELGQFSCQQKEAIPFVRLPSLYLPVFFCVCVMSLPLSLFFSFPHFIFKLFGVSSRSLDGALFDNRNFFVIRCKLPYGIHHCGCLSVAFLCFRD